MVCFNTHFSNSALSYATALLLFSYHLENKLQLDPGPEQETTEKQTWIPQTRWNQAQLSPTQQLLHPEERARTSDYCFSH